MKPKFCLAAVVSTTAIATSILFTSVASAQPCPFKQRSSSINWLRTPLVAALTIPGIALAVSLYLGGRSYQADRQ